jgi:hypothetical protein
MMRVMPENKTPAFVNIDESPCAAGLSAIHSAGGLRIIDAVASRRRRSKVRRADSESPFLAMKKFSRIPASRRFGARQDRIFAGILATDSQLRCSSRRSIATRPGVREGRHTP